MGEGKLWRQMVEERFDFLVEHGFRLTDVDDSTVWTISVTYASPTSALQVSKSNEFIRSEVHLVRLVDGQLPPYPIWVTEARIDWTCSTTSSRPAHPVCLSDPFS